MYICMIEILLLRKVEHIRLILYLNILVSAQHRMPYSIFYKPWLSSIQQWFMIKLS